MRIIASPIQAAARPLAAMHLESPLGLLRAEATPLGIRSLGFVTSNEAPGIDDGPAEDHAACSHFQKLRRELAQYVAGEPVNFTTPLDPVGTPFQRRVWNELRTIPFGETISYSTLAGRIAQPDAARAVARANAANPIAILIPCHRVIGADGALTGYAGGLDRKRALLEIEGVYRLFARQP